MTIPSTTRRAGPFYGPMASGAQIPFSFKVFAATDIAVTIADADGVESVGVLGSNYLVTLNADQTTSPGGYVQYAVGGVVTALPTGYTIAINGARAYAQDTQLTQGSNFNPIAIERALDVLTVLVQQLKDAYDRTAKITVLSPSSTDTTLPIPQARAVIGWNDDGTALQNFEPNSVDLSVATLAADLASTANGSKGDALIGVKRTETGAVARTQHAKNLERVTAKDFGAVEDGVTDDSAAIQAAIDACASAGDWKTLVITGKCRIASSINIDRLVDTKVHDFKIVGEGPGAGFYTSGNVTIFDSTLTTTTTPQSELVTFENLAFESSSVFNTSYVLSKKFLRVKFVNCQFYLIRCFNSDIYAQTVHFIGCDIRNNPARFITCAGLYDVLFDGCRIYNGSGIVRCVDATRGTNGLRFIGCMIENIYAESIVSCTGASGFLLEGCHLENNFSPEFNFFAGGITNKSISANGNYIFNPNGASFYYGPTDAVHSSGNTVSPSVMHSNANQIGGLISVADKCVGGISDATINATINGVYRAGAAQDVWSHSANHLNKSVAGEFGFGAASLAGTRMYVRGANQLATEYAGVWADSNGNSILLLRNDRQIQAPALGNYANDAGAAAGGVAIGSLYRNGSVVQVRVT